MKKDTTLYRCSGYDTHYNACMDCPKGDLHEHRDCCDVDVECQWRRDHPSVRCVKHAATTPLDQFDSITAITPAMIGNEVGKRTTAFEAQIASPAKPDGVCCQYCIHFEGDCPIKEASPWSRWGNWCNVYSPNPAEPDAKPLRVAR